MNSEQIFLQNAEDDREVLEASDVQRDLRPDRTGLHDIRRSEVGGFLYSALVHRGVHLSLNIVIHR